MEGLIGINNTWFRNIRTIGKEESLDGFKETGMYFADNDTYQMVLLVFSFSYGTIQIMSGNGGSFKFRSYWGVWNGWKTLI